jgi:hypothetical protein
MLAHLISSTRFGDANTIEVAAPEVRSGLLLEAASAGGVEEVKMDGIDKDGSALSTRRFLFEQCMQNDRARAASDQETAAGEFRVFDFDCYRD